MSDDMTPMKITELKSLSGDVVRDMRDTLKDARKLVAANPSPATVNTASRVGATIANVVNVVMTHGLADADEDSEGEG